jgi:hypothetical protein
MYKFYQEQPENSWACHPIRGGKDVDEKKNSGSNSTEHEWDAFGMGTEEDVMQQGQNKKPEFAGSISPVNKAQVQTPPLSQKNSVMPGDMSPGNEKRNGLPKWVGGAINIIKDAASISSGAYTPDGFLPSRSLPGQVAGFFNYMSMRDIDKWEARNKKKNSVKRERVERMKNAPFISPIVRGYEKTMDVKEIRELAFPFRSPVHAVAATDIGLGANDAYNNLSSASDRFAKKIDNYFDGNDEENGEKPYLSNLRNSMRHTIWQATLASQYNPQVAYSAGMAHETRPYADTDKRVFDNESEADMTVDLLNNVIGRRIGANNRHLSRKQIALLALKELRENGLYRYEYCSDGLWRVMKVRISDDVYNDMYNTFMNLDNDGK